MRIALPRLALSITLTAGATTLLTGGCKSESPTTTRPAAVDSASPAAGTTTTRPAARIELALNDAQMISLPPSVQEQIRTALSKIESSPTDASAAGELGMIYFANDLPSDAAQCFTTAASRAPNELRWHYYLGLAMEKLDNTSGAAKAYEAAMMIDSKNAPVLVRLAEMTRERSVNRAKRLFERALEQNPRYARAYVGLGNCLKASGKNEEAISAFLKAIELEPRYADAHYALAQALKTVGKDAEAAQHLQLAQVGDPASSEQDPLMQALAVRMASATDVITRATRLIDRKDYEEAIKLLEGTLSEDTGTVIRTKLATLYAMTGRNEKAVKLFREILAEMPTSPIAKANLAFALLQARELDEAEKLLREVLDVNPGDLVALERCFGIMIMRGRANEALQLTETLAKRRPEDAAVQFFYGQALAKNGRGKEAFPPLERAAELAPTNPRVHYLLGLLQLEVNQNRVAARQRLEQAITVDPPFVDGYMSLFVLLYQDRDWTQLEKLLRTGVRHAPDSPDLNNALAYFLATCPEDVYRNGPEAVRLATKACDATQRNNAEFLDSLAAAYAEAGDMAKAVETAQLAISVAERTGQTGRIADFRKRLESYQAGRPYREQGP